jgi:hypothetical protein
VHPDHKTGLCGGRRWQVHPASQSNATSSTLTQQLKVHNKNTLRKRRATGQIITAYYNSACWGHLQQLLVPVNTCVHNKEQSYNTSRQWDARQTRSKYAAGCRNSTQGEKFSVLCTYICACVVIYTHTTTLVTPKLRSAASKCDIPTAHIACSKTQTHQRDRRNHPIRHSLSTVSLLVSLLSGPESQPCGPGRSCIKFDYPLVGNIRSNCHNNLQGTIFILL